MFRNIIIFVSALCISLVCAFIIQTWPSHLGMLGRKLLALPGALMVIGAIANVMISVRMSYVHALTLNGGGYPIYAHSIFTSAFLGFGLFCIYLAISLPGSLPFKALPLITVVSICAGLLHAFTILHADRMGAAGRRDKPL